MNAYTPAGYKNARGAALQDTSPVAGAGRPEIRARMRKGAS
jgi:hypothetical protein